jgi:hypothetical protein
MKLLIAVLLIPLSYAGSPPNCEELGAILQGYEKDLNRKAIKDCGKLKPEGLLGDRKVVKPEFLKDKTCLELGDIETQTERLKAELAILDGIEKLKAAVDKNSNPSTTQEGHRFVASLNTAQSLELILNTKNDKKETLAEFLKKQIRSKDEITSKVEDFCKDRDKKGVDACNPDAFNPETEAKQEIFNLIHNATVDSEKIKNWQDSLAIKRKDNTESNYSFHIMQTELNQAFEAIDNKKRMTRAHLNAIKRLDDFVDAPTDMGFVNDIHSIKDKKKTKILSDKLFLLMGDAKARQQYEMQSKVSILFENYKNDLTNLAGCSEAKSSFDKAKTCYEEMKKKEGITIGTQSFSSPLESIQASLDFISKLSESESKCKKELTDSELLSQACYQTFTKDKADLQDQILQLNVLKEKIGFENTDLMTYRNLALNKWYQNSSCGRVESVMDLCDATDTSETISKTALMTVSESMSVAVMFNPKPDEEVNKKAEELCGDDKKKKTKSEERLCEFFNDTTTNVVTKNEDNSDGPVNAPDGGHTDAKIRDAWLQGGANLLAQGLSTYLQRNMTPPPVVNPYPYNYAPYSGGGNGMGIADSIMFNARYQGAYGFYMPTQGLPPGQAFPSSSMSGYQALSGSGSKYFGR